MINHSPFKMAKFDHHILSSGGLKITEIRVATVTSGSEDVFVIGASAGAADKTAVKT